MSDALARARERAKRSDPTDTAAASAVLADRIRTGELPRWRAELAAYCGDPAAWEVTAPPPREVQRSEGRVCCCGSDESDSEHGSGGVDAYTHGFVHACTYRSSDAARLAACDPIGIEEWAEREKGCTCTPRTWTELVAVHRQAPPERWRPWSRGLSRFFVHDARAFFVIAECVLVAASSRLAFSAGHRGYPYSRIALTVENAARAISALRALIRRERPNPEDFDRIRECGIGPIIPIKALAEGAMVPADTDIHELETLVPGGQDVARRIISGALRTWALRAGDEKMAPAPAPPRIGDY